MVIKFTKKDLETITRYLEQFFETKPQAAFELTPLTQEQSTLVMYHLTRTGYVCTQIQVHDLEENGHY